MNTLSGVIILASKCKKTSKYQFCSELTRSFFIGSLSLVLWDTVLWAALCFLLDKFCLMWNADSSQLSGYKGISCKAETTSHSNSKCQASWIWACPSQCIFQISDAVCNTTTVCLVFPGWKIHIERAVWVPLFWWNALAGKQQFDNSLSSVTFLQALSLVGLFTFFFSMYTQTATSKSRLTQHGTRLKSQIYSFSLFLPLLTLLALSSLLAFAVSNFLFCRRFIWRYKPVTFSFCLQLNGLHCFASPPSKETLANVCK